MVRGERASTAGAGAVPSPHRASTDPSTPTHYVRINIKDLHGESFVRLTPVIRGKCDKSSILLALPRLTAPDALLPLEDASHKCLTSTRSNERAHTLLRTTSRSTFAKPRLTFTEPRSTFAKPRLTFTEPRSTFAEPRLTFAEPRLTFAEPRLTFAEPRLTFAEPRSTFAEPRLTFAEPRSTFTEPRSTFTEPRSTFAEPRSTFTEPRSTFTEPRLTFPLRNSKPLRRETLLFKAPLLLPPLR